MSSFSSPPAPPESRLPGRPPKVPAPAPAPADLEASEAAPLLPKKGGGGDEAPDDDDDRPCVPRSEQHFPFIDITRICCVWLVSVDHADHSFGARNTLFGQNWVLQYLFLVCGFCYAMSRRSLGGYLLRLGCYAVLGICINWSAWVFKGMDWKTNFFNVVFHFWFVLGLMMYGILLAPLRVYLQGVRDRSLEEQQRQIAAEAADPATGAAAGTGGTARKAEREHKDSLTYAITCIGGGVVGLIILFTVVVRPLLYLTAPILVDLVHHLGSATAFWGLPQTTSESIEFLERFCTYLMLTCSNFWLLIVCPRVFNRSSLTGWFLLANTYGHRMLYYRANDERPFHGLDLMTIALTVYYLGLLHRRKLGEYIVRYWFVLLFVAGLLWPEGTFARFDESPPKDMTTRIRVNLLEAMFVVTWLVAGERLIQKEIFTVDKVDFLNDWALVVFLTHKAVHILLAPPFNWFCLLGLIPVCYLRRHMP